MFFIVYKSVVTKYDKHSPKEREREANFLTISRIPGWLHIFLVMGTIRNGCLMEGFSF